jgi:hypothetical protein
MKALYLSLALVGLLLFAGCGIAKQDHLTEVKYNISGTISSVSKNITLLVGAYKGNPETDLPEDLRVYMQEEFSCFGSFCSVDYQLNVPAGTYQIIAYQEIIEPAGISPGDRVGRPGSTTTNVTHDLVSVNMGMAIY